MSDTVKVIPTLGLDVIFTAIFVTLKLANVITWSWLWVLSPLWISFGIGVIIITAVILFSS